jgi:hypothetical protein
MSRNDTIVTVIACTLAGLATVVSSSPVQSSDSGPLRLEAKIPLGNVVGRIDHMAIDVARRRLFVAELGNGSVSDVDLVRKAVVGRISHLREPQGLAYVPATDTLYVASGGDGSVRTFSGTELNESGRIELGRDADNIHFDRSHKTLFVGYGEGGLAAIDVEGWSKYADIALGAHPEGFQLESIGDRIFVNVPQARSIMVANREKGTLEVKWPTGSLRDNFPMALNEDRKEVLSVFRSPPDLAAFSMADGSMVANTETCGDSDDVFVDEKRRRIYVSCGEGAVDIFEDVPSLVKIGRIQTVSGARTSLFIPELDRLIVAARAGSDHSAALWVYRPVP